MRHSREEVIKRTIREFDRLDHLVNNLTDQDWNRLLTGPETKDPWTVKDVLANVTHWKADVVRKIKKQPVPVEEKGSVGRMGTTTSTSVGEIAPHRRY